VEILAAELAQKAGTIPWEIFTGVGRRVERVYL
jgi:alanine racemase